MWLSEKQRKKIRDHSEKEKEREQQLNTKLNKAVKITLDVEHIKAIEEREERFVFRPLNEADFEESDNEDEYYTDRMPKMPDISDLIEAVSL